MSTNHKQEIATPLSMSLMRHSDQNWSVSNYNLFLFSFAHDHKTRQQETNMQLSIPQEKPIDVYDLDVTSVGLATQRFPAASLTWSMSHCYVILKLS